MLKDPVLWMYLLKQVGGLMSSDNGRTVLAVIALLVALRLLVMALSSLPQLCEDWLRQRKTQTRWKSRGVSPAAVKLWKEWNEINLAGRNAYYKGAHAEAERQFKALLWMTKGLGSSFPWRAPRDGESSRWWQAEIVREGAYDWNAWRRANPNVVPDLRGQDLSLISHAAPCSPDDYLQEQGIRARDLRGANFRGADLQNVNLSGCDLRGADFREANIEDTDFDGADLTGAAGLPHG